MSELQLKSRQLMLDLVAIGSTLGSEKFARRKNCIRNFFNQIQTAGGEFPGYRVKDVITVHVCDCAIQFVEYDDYYAVIGMQFLDEDD